MMVQIARHEQEVFEALKYRIDVDTHGTRRYYNCTGRYHRDEGPAVEYTNGTKYWYQNGLPHRIDGPAIEYKSGHKEWWLNGEELTEAEFNQRIKSL